MVSLHDLPHFVIANISNSGSNSLLTGSIVGPPVQAGRSYLYISGQESIIGDLSIGEQGKLAIFTAPDWSMNDHAQIGASLPIIREPWQARQVAMVLDMQHLWQRKQFIPVDAAAITQPGQDPHWRMTIRMGTLPTDATLVRVIPGGWDHEHCDFCFQKIGIGGQEFGYVDTEDKWLCEACYHNYAEQHDLAFLMLQ